MHGLSACSGYHPPCQVRPCLSYETALPASFGSLPAVDLLINERQVVTREVRGGYYHPSAYLLSKLTLDASECGSENLVVVLSVCSQSCVSLVSTDVR